MADQSSSSSAPHFVFSDLLNLPNPTCGVAAERACLECDSCQTAHLLHKLKSDVSDIQSSLENLSNFGRDLCRHMEPLADRVREGNIQPDDVCDILDEPRFRELIRAVKQFKLQLPCTSYYELSDGNPRSVNWESDHLARADNSAAALIDQLRSEYDTLSENLKKCLCCCSVFDSEIKKRVLINWWIGEELLHNSTADSNGEVKKLEQAGEDVLKLLEQKQFINRVHKKRRATDVWRMEPPVRLLVRPKAKADNFFDFDKRILSEKVILLKSDNEIDALLDATMANDVKTVFNVDRLRIGVNEAKTLASMESLAVLHLGRSQRKAKQHIHVKNLKWIMERLKKMKQLRLLSLQGISSIRELSDSVSKLKGLMVLDLRACQALESLPSTIGNLKSLTHLDVSGCYILLPLPKEVSSLTNLEVLKGFVIVNEESTGTSKSCTLGDLRMLKKLHKLSIFVSRENFPQREDLRDLANIQGLVNLKILWIPALSKEDGQENARSDHNELGQESQEDGQARSIQGKVNADSIQYEQGQENTNLVHNVQVQEAANRVVNSPAESSRYWTPTMFTCCFKTQLEEENNREVLEKLEKLDLWYPPEDAARMLLAPKNFTALKKLYIRWAKFQHLNYNHVAEKWNVNMLRLLFLPNLEMSWAELKDDLFPKLSYLELQDCPKLQFSRYCDEEGVWIDQNC